MANVRVAAIARADLADVVTIHRVAFPDGAITALGDEAVRRYYTWLLEGPHDAVITGAWLDGKLVGFCAAGVFRGAMSGFLRRNRVYLARHVITHPRLLLSELIRDRISTALRVTARFSRARRQPSATSPAPSFGVLAIATATNVRGSGAGRAMMVEAEGRARAAGYPRMVLTVHPNNCRAVQFYEQLDWTRCDENGRWQGLMEKRF